MSEKHLRDLRNRLEANHWHFVREEPGDGYRISAVWIIERPDGSNRLHIAFEGLDDMHTLPIGESYGCSVQEHPEISLYFARVSRSWPAELSRFINKLNSAAQDTAAS